MANKVVVFMDFDGVINWHGTSRSQVKKYADAFGYWRRHSVPLDSGVAGGWGTYSTVMQDISWSAELVKKLMDLKEDTGYVWRWLSTWVNETEKLDRILGIKSDGWVNWNPYPVPSVDDISAYRCARKLDVVLDFAKNNPDTPFVWVDDEAVDLWTDDHAASMTAPHLVVKPWEKFGLVKHDLAKISDFVKTHSA
jgi:hypothetical protein